MDRVIRFVLGIVLVVLGYTMFTGVIKIVVYVLAFIALFTSVTGFCLLYKIFGINTLINGIKLPIKGSNVVQGLQQTPVSASI